MNGIVNNTEDRHDARIRRGQRDYFNMEVEHTGRITGVKVTYSGSMHHWNHRRYILPESAFQDAEAKLLVDEGDHDAQNGEEQKDQNVEWENHLGNENGGQVEQGWQKDKRDGVYNCSKCDKPYLRKALLQKHVENCTITKVHGDALERAVAMADLFINEEITVQWYSRHEENPKLALVANPQAADCRIVERG